MKKYDREMICSVCGDPTGYPYDHSKCAETNKAVYGDSGENKHPLKKYSKKRAKCTGDYFAKKYS